MTEQRIFDASTLETDLLLEVDVAIVGTGAGGGTSAEILSQAGLKVALLEEGGYYTARDFTLEESKAYATLYQETAVRLTKDKAVQILQGRAVGGSTVVNWTTSFRTPEQTLRHWTEVHGLKGYAMADLLPWFERMEQRLNIHKWTEAEPNANNQLLLDGCHKLGYHADLISRNVKDCQNLGYCGVGCPLDAKQSMLVTTIPAALQQGALLVSRVRVERLTIAGDRVTGVEGAALDGMSVRPTGRKVTVKAAAVVLAGGAVGSPAVLLRSQAPDPSGMTGKRTCLHPVIASEATMRERVDGFYGAPQSAYCDEFLWPGGEGGRGPIGYKLEVPPLQPLVALPGIKLNGRGHAERAATLPYMHMQIALLRDGFHADSQGGSVELRDDGSPVLDYPLTDYVLDGCRRAYLTMAELQFAVGAVSVQPRHMAGGSYTSWAEAKSAIEALPMGALKTLVVSAHVMGGCTMGEDPKTSVVNSQGRHHQLGNLWVLDGSALPTSLGVNPQLTIYAIVARNATRMAETLGAKPRQTAGG